jgi:mono/diheme cytochrome c family protein
MRLVGILATTAAMVLAVQASSSAATPTFTKDIAPILYEKCATCHRPGEIAPMTLMTFEDARPWAKAIKAKVVSREMPPWGADHENTLKMRNDRSLSEAQIQAIAAWVDAGAPRGNPADLPPAPKFAEGWTHGTEPDYIIEMPLEVAIPAEGELSVLNFYSKVPFDVDRFAQVVELRPGNRSVVHHAGIYFVDLPEGGTLDAEGRLTVAEGARRGGGREFGLPGSSKLLSFVPGRGVDVHRENIGKRIPAGKYINWQMHYNPTGKLEKDRSRLGIWFNKVPVTHEVLIPQAGDPLATTKGGLSLYRAEGKEVEYTADEASQQRNRRTPNIPPNVENWRLTGITPVTEDITLYAMSPHMHLRGKSVKWVITYPDGREQTILNVPKFDFNWQINYELDEPLHIPAGSKISGIGVYDNSLKNKWNPAPHLEVFWSEQSWDEMYQPFTEYSVDSQDLTKIVPVNSQQQP